MFDRWLLLASVSFLLLAACEDPREKQAALRKECNAFITILNENSSLLAKYTGKGNEADPTEHEDAAKSRFELAKVYDDVSTKVSAAELTDPKLVQWATEYKDVARAAAGAARKAGRALKSEEPDVDKANAAQDEFNKIVKKENALVQSINAYCAALPSVE